MALALDYQVIPIKGILPVSMLDWDGMLACVVFTGGCNFKCPICHNADLAANTSHISNISWQEIERHLTSKKDWLDGVVITGGEPTIHKNLINFICQIKDLGLAVKLDTNGSLPEALVEILETGLVDYVAMDIKTSFKNYEQAAGVEIDTENIKKSVDVLIKSGVDCEFRTTIVPGTTEEKDLLEIAEFISNAKRYYLQQFKPEKVLEPQASKIKPFTNEELRKFAKKCSQFIKTRTRLI